MKRVNQKATSKRVPAKSASKSSRKKDGVLNRFSRWCFKLFLYAVGIFLSSSLLAVVAYRWIPVYVTPLMLIRSIEHRGDATFMYWQHSWVSLEEMSPYLPVAVMASEDQRFLDHHGFDFKAIEEAREEYQAGGRRRGASTISQQTAKNVFLWPNSSWIRKGFETYFTVLIEWIWPKERILEVYLNSIEMGPGIYGAEAVAVANFDKTAATLSRSDCALIAATLPAPLRFSSKDPSAYMLRRQNQIKRQMRFIDLLPSAKEAK